MTTYSKRSLALISFWGTRLADLQVGLTQGGFSAALNFPDVAVDAIVEIACMAEQVLGEAYEAQDARLGTAAGDIVALMRTAAEEMH